MDMQRIKHQQTIHYKDYLQLDKILQAQLPESKKDGNEAHDETLFIITHQAYELWFKQVIHELNSILEIMGEEDFNLRSSKLHVVIDRLRRISKIFTLLVQQLDVLESMSAMGFMEFRRLLSTASGFQSFQFRQIEAMMGLKFSERHGCAHYKKHLHPCQLGQLMGMSDNPSILSLVNNWLEKLPYFEESLWSDYTPKFPLSYSRHVFWNDYRHLYVKSLIETDDEKLKYFDEKIIRDENNPAGLSTKARRAGLFIFLYQDCPALNGGFQLLNLLLEIDEQMALWRYRHLNLVRRMIGTKSGTGGSSGQDYLMKSLSKHYVFSDIAELNTFLIRRTELPALGQLLSQEFGLIYNDYLPKTG